jgi:hypothetical protein
MAEFSQFFGSQLGMGFETMLFWTVWGNVQLYHIIILIVFVTILFLVLRSDKK